MCIFCSVCGIVPVVTGPIEGNVYAVVSVNAFDHVKPELLRRGSVSFDGEGEGDRFANLPIRTARLELRPLRETDVAPLFAIHSDPKVMSTGMRRSGRTTNPDVQWSPGILP